MWQHNHKKHLTAVSLRNVQAETKWVTKTVIVTTYDVTPSGGWINCESKVTVTETCTTTSSIKKADRFPAVIDMSPFKRTSGQKVVISGDIEIIIDGVRFVIPEGEHRIANDQIRTIAFRAS